MSGIGWVKGSKREKGGNRVKIGNRVKAVKRVKNVKNVNRVNRVNRGGCWSSYAVGCRSANRNSYAPSNHLNALGLRIARVVP